MLFAGSQHCRCAADARANGFAGPFMDLFAFGRPRGPQGGLLGVPILSVTLAEFVHGPYIDAHFPGCLFHGGAGQHDGEHLADEFLHAVAGRLGRRKLRPRASENNCCHTTGLPWRNFLSR